MSGVQITGPLRPYSPSPISPCAQQLSGEEIAQFRRSADLKRVEHRNAIRVLKTRLCSRSWALPVPRVFALRRDAHRQLLVAAQQARQNTLRLARHLDDREASHNFLPEHAQLHLGETQAEAAVDAETERDVVPGVLPVDDEVVRPVEHFLIAVAGGVPHQNLVTLSDHFAAELDVLDGPAAHV